jgi:hypothetical protein
MIKKNTEYTAKTVDTDLPFPVYSEFVGVFRVPSIGVADGG